MDRVGWQKGLPGSLYLINRQTEVFETKARSQGNGDNKRWSIQPAAMLCKSTVAQRLDHSIAKKWIIACTSKARKELAQHRGLATIATKIAGSPNRLSTKKGWSLERMNHWVKYTTGKKGNNQQSRTVMIVSLYPQRRWTDTVWEENGPTVVGRRVSVCHGHWRGLHDGSWDSW